MDRARLREHCESVVASGSPMLKEEHSEVLSLLEENARLRRALEVIRDLLTCGDDMSSLAQEVLEGKTELLDRL